MTTYAESGMGVLRHIVAALLAHRRSGVSDGANTSRNATDYRVIDYRIRHGSCERCPSSGGGLGHATRKPLDRPGEVHGSASADKTTRQPASPMNPRRYGAEIQTVMPGSSPSTLPVGSARTAKVLRS